MGRYMGSWARKKAGEREPPPAPKEKNDQEKKNDRYDSARSRAEHQSGVASGNIFESYTGGDKSKEANTAESHAKAAGLQREAAEARKGTSLQERFPDDKRHEQRAVAHEAHAATLTAKTPEDHAKAEKLHREAAEGAKAQNLKYIAEGHLEKAKEHAARAGTDDLPRDEHGRFTGTGGQGSLF